MQNHSSLHYLKPLNSWNPLTLNFLSFAHFDVSGSLAAALKGAIGGKPVNAVVSLPHMQENEQLT